MWEWGSFPQKTPVRTMFPPMEEKGKERRKGKERMSELELDTDVGSGGGRMVSSPVELIPEEGVVGEEGLSYGAGGRLAIDRRDPTRFRVSIERRVVDFELSIVQGAGEVDGNRTGAGPLGGEDEVIDDQRYEEGKVDFDRFLEDERIVKDEDLVLKWAGGT